MSIWLLSQIKNLLKALNSGQTPTQLAGGIVFGLFLGFPPFNFLYFLIVFISLLFANVNITLALLTLAITKLFAGSNERAIWHQDRDSRTQITQ